MPATTPGQFRLFYVDDSGSSDSGLVVYAFLECPARAWRTSLQRLLDLREDLHLRHGIPPGYQLHAASFATGHGNPSTWAGWNRQPRLRAAVVEQILAHLAADPDLRIGVVYRATSAKRHAYQQHRAEVYRVWSPTSTSGCTPTANTDWSSPAATVATRPTRRHIGPSPTNAGAWSKTPSSNTPAAATGYRWPTSSPGPPTNTCAATQPALGVGVVHRPSPGPRHPGGPL